MRPNNYNLLSRWTFSIKFIQFGCERQLAVSIKLAATVGRYDLIKFAISVRCTFVVTCTYTIILFYDFWQTVCEMWKREEDTAGSGWADRRTRQWHAISYIWNGEFDVYKSFRLRRHFFSFFRFLYHCSAFTYICIYGHCVRSELSVHHLCSNCVRSDDVWRIYMHKCIR